MSDPIETRCTKWIAYGHYGYTHYRIWERKTAHGMFQRHEWRREDLSEECGDWIPSPFNWNTGATVDAAKGG